MPRLLYSGFYHQKQFYKFKVEKKIVWERNVFVELEKNLCLLDCGFFVVAMTEKVKKK